MDGSSASKLHSHKLPVDSAVRGSFFPLESKPLGYQDFSVHKVYDVLIQDTCTIEDSFEIF